MVERFPAIRGAIFLKQSTLFCQKSNAASCWARCDYGALFMHEMSIITSLLSIVREEMSRHNVSKLLVVRVRYGVLTNIVPEAMAFAFEALTTGTDLEGAKLETEEIPLTLHCAACDKEFSTTDRNVFRATCPFCGCNEGHVPMNGRELYLQHLEAE